MRCEIEYTDEFEEWWNALTEDEQIAVASMVNLLAERGTALPFPYSSNLKTSKYSHMRELRIQHSGDPYRVLYAFDPRRVAILLIGGLKRGDDIWYKKIVPLADKIYRNHINTLNKKG